MKLSSCLPLIATTAALLLASVATAVEDEAPPSVRQGDGNVELFNQQEQHLSRSLLRSPVEANSRNLVIGGKLCESGTANICICHEDKLRAAFAKAGSNALLPTVIQLCYGSVFTLSTPIDITGKSFSLNCLRPEQCEFNGNNSQVFVGAPVKAIFVFLTISSAESVTNGGAMHLTGGKTRFINLQVKNNFSNATGGAIFVEGPNTELEFSGTIFQDNYANSGGAIAVSNGAKVTSLRSSFLRNNANETGGAVHMDSGTFKAAISLMQNNYAAGSGWDVWMTGKAKLDCALILKSTFCNGKSGVVQDGSGTSSNCRGRGIFKIDPRCPVLKYLADDDFF